MFCRLLSIVLFWRLLSRMWINTLGMSRWDTWGWVYAIMTRTTLLVFHLVPISRVNTSVNQTNNIFCICLWACRLWCSLFLFRPMYWSELKRPAHTWLNANSVLVFSNSGTFPSILHLSLWFPVVRTNLTIDLRRSNLGFSSGIQDDLVHLRCETWEGSPKSF